MSGTQVPTLAKPTTESRVADALARLDTGIAQLSTTPGWLAWLRMQSKFHSYSANNTLLIAMQRPGATRVAGYSAWKDLGRFVRKGERGISILAPVTYRAKSVATDVDDTASQETARRVVGFRTVNVFDISQTDGDALPQAPSRGLEGDSPDGVSDELERQIEALGYRVITDELAPGRYGVTHFIEETVTIASGVSPAQRTKTLAHELAHIHLHHPDAGVLRSFADCRGTVELEAESVAFVVCAAHGLDTSDYSFGYVTSWAGGDDAARTTLALRAEAIRKSAHRILEGENPSWFTEREAA